MTSCYSCHNRVDEALLMACHHHLCLPCSSTRLEDEKNVKCACKEVTKLTDEAYKVIIAQNCHNRSMCQPDACGRVSPYGSPKNANLGNRDAPTYKFGGAVPSYDVTDE